MILSNFQRFSQGCLCEVARPAAKNAGKGVFSDRTPGAKHVSRPVVYSIGGLFRTPIQKNTDTTNSFLELQMHRWTKERTVDSNGLLFCCPYNWILREPICLCFHISVWIMDAPNGFCNDGE